MAKQIETVAELRKAVKAASECLIQVRFGCCEKWIKIAKSEVLGQLLVGLEGAPEHNEMYSGYFGELDNGILYLG
jgi:hypothetical protein